MIGKSGAVVVISVVSCPGGAGHWFDSMVVQVFFAAKINNISGTKRSDCWDA